MHMEWNGMKNWSEPLYGPRYTQVFVRTFLPLKPMSKSRQCCSFNVVTDCTQTSNILSDQEKGTEVSMSECCQVTKCELRHVHEQLCPFSAETKYEYSCNSTPPAICPHALLRNVFHLQEGKRSITLYINPNIHTYIYIPKYIYIYTFHSPL